MIRKTILTTLAAAALSAAAMGATATSASAGIKIFLGGGGFYGPAYGYGYNAGYGYGGSFRKCRLKRKHVRVWSSYQYRYVWRTIYVKKCHRVYY